MANPLKFLTSVTASSGLAVTGSDGLIVQQGGLTVQAGNVTLPAASVSVDALSSKTVVVGTTSASLGTTVSSLEGLTTVDTTNLEVSNIKAKDGTSAVTIANSTGIVTITSLTGTTVDINGGAIDGTTIGASTQSSGKFTTLSGSGALDVAGAATLAGGLTVTGAALNASTVAVSASAISASSYVGNGSGLTGVIATGVAANSVALGTDTTGNYVASVAAASGEGLTVTGTGEGASVTVGLKNAGSLSSNKVLKWDETNNQLVDSSVTDDGTKVTLTTELTGTAAYFTQNLTVVGTASFGLLNVINQQSLNVGDKYIVVASGSTGHENLEGAGMLWGSGAVGATLFPDANAHAAIVYRNSSDRLEIFPGLSSSYITASVLNVVGTAKFDGNVTLGNASSDSITVTGDLTASANAKFDGDVTLGNSATDKVTVTAQLTASEGLNIASGKTVKINDSDILKKQEILVQPFSSNDYYQFTGSTLVNGEDSALVGIGVLTSSNGQFSPTVFLSSSGDVFLRANSNVALIANETIAFTAPNGVYVGVEDGDFSQFPQNQYGEVNITGALATLQNSINNIGPSGLSSDQYYSVRASGYRSLQSNGEDSVFILTGSTSFQPQQSNYKNLGGIEGLTDESATTLFDKMGDMSIDVAVAAATGGNLGYTWTNDLVSVYVTASNSGSSVYYPVITVSAPALESNSRVRLIVVNENSSILNTNQAGGGNSVNWIMAQSVSSSAILNLSNDGVTVDQTEDWSYFSSNPFNATGSDYVGSFTAQADGKYLQISSSNGQSGWTHVTSSDGIFLNWKTNTITYPNV
jgi:hypothetical protein